MPVVYMATNILNGKRYIGATKFSMEKRKSVHVSNHRHRGGRCERLYAAMRKYGKESFEWVTLEIFDTSHDAFAREKELIAQLKPEYNVTPGGEEPGFRRGYNLVPVVCLEDGKIYPSITAASIAYKIDVSSLAALVKGKKRRGTTLGGLHFAYYNAPLSNQERLDMITSIEKDAIERRKRGGPKHRNGAISDGKDALGRSAAGPMKNARAVICVTTEKQFPSISEAARFYDIDKGAIVELCQGKRYRKFVGGLVFKYAEAA